MTAADSADTAVYRPFPGKVPANVVGASAAFDDVRFTQFDGRVVDACRLARAVAARLAVVALSVHPACRPAGIRCWLPGHAIGIGELVGGHIVDVVAETPLRPGDVAADGLRDRVVGLRCDWR